MTVIRLSLATASVILLTLTSAHAEEPVVPGDLRDMAAAHGQVAPPATTPPAAAPPKEKAPATVAPAATAPAATTPADASPTEPNAGENAAAAAPPPANAAASPAPAAAEPAGTPLSLRESKPLELAPTREESSVWWKMIAFAAVLGGAWLFFRKRALFKAATAESHSLKVLKRTAIGVRSELCIVDVDGQKLLVGVTPSNIQRLAVLEDAPPLEEAEPGFAGNMQNALDRLLASRGGAS